MPKVCNVFLLNNFVVVVVAVNFLYFSPFLFFVFSFVFINSLPYMTLPRNNEKTKINCNICHHVLWLHTQRNSD